MKTPLLILIILCSSVLLPGISIHEIEDRAAAGEAQAICALRDSADSGMLRAMNFLGYLYWQGEGVRQDRDSALYYLQMASDKGDAKAAANLGHLLLSGAENLTADTARALQLLDYAASRHAPAAIRELADYFESNPGDSASAHMLKRIADAYSHGYVLRYNYRKSIEYYNRAAELGDTLSRRIISELLEFFPDIMEPGRSPSRPRGDSD